MTNYYIEKDNKIVLFDTNKKRIQTTLKFMPQYQNLEIKETNKEIIMRNNTFVFVESIQDELLQEAKETKIAQINLAKEAAFKQGIIYNNEHFDCDDRAQDRTGNRLILMQAMPVETLEWLDFDYKSVTLSANQFYELCTAIFERIQEIEFKTGEFLDAVSNAATQEDLDNIVIEY